MEIMQDARRAVLELRYNGKDVTEDITKSLTDFQYNDAASGSLDDLTVTLEDRGTIGRGLGHRLKAIN